MHPEPPNGAAHAPGRNAGASNEVTSLPPEMMLLFAADEKYVTPLLATT